MIGPSKKQWERVLRLARLGLQEADPNVFYLNRDAIDAVSRFMEYPRLYKHKLAPNGYRPYPPTQRVRSYVMAPPELPVKKVQRKKPHKE